MKDLQARLLNDELLNLVKPVLRMLHPRLTSSTLFNLFRTIEYRWEAHPDRRDEVRRFCAVLESALRVLDQPPTSTSLVIEVNIAWTTVIGEAGSKGAFQFPLPAEGPGRADYNGKLLEFMMWINPLIAPDPVEVSE